MKTLVPEYYLRFQCTASACIHNCCREGWEIGIDDDHAVKYKTIASEPEKNCSGQVREGIFLPTVKERRQGMRPHIRLAENGICPFLCEDGLCVLIKNFGENILCQICADHPRFRNFYSDHTEMGIGLCCEEAVRLILGTEAPVRYVSLQNGEPMEPEHRKYGLEDRYRKLRMKKLDICGLTEYLLCLDCLEEEWVGMLEAVRRENSADVPDVPDTGPWRAVEEYLLFRHLVKDGPEITTALYQLIRSLYRNREILPGCEPEQRMAEILRVFSSEIEYSEDAVETVKSKIHA